MPASAEPGCCAVFFFCVDRPPISGRRRGPRARLPQPRVARGVVRTGVRAAISRRRRPRPTPPARSPPRPPPLAHSAGSSIKAHVKKGLKTRNRLGEIAGEIAAPRIRIDMRSSTPPEKTRAFLFFCARAAAAGSHRRTHASAWGSVAPAFQATQSRIWGLCRF